MDKKKIIYDIGFKVDDGGIDKATGSLAKITNTLKQIQNMDIGTFMKTSGITDIQKAEEQLKLVKASAVAAGNALYSSFNQKLNTYNITKANKLLKEAGFQAKDLGSLWIQAGEQGHLAFNQVANAMTQVQGVAVKTTGVFNELGKTMANTIRWKVTSSLVNSFTGAIQQAWGYTKALDTSLNNIRIVTGKSALEMEKFAKSANKAAGRLGASTTAYTDAALIYYQQGLSDKEAQARTNVTIKAANVTGQSAAEVSEQLTAVWNGYKVVAEEAELYVDKLAAVAATTAADLEELSTGMSKVASAANSMGVDIDQLSAQMATIVSVTRQDASLVGTALKTIYARMGDLEVDGVDEFGTSLGDVSGKMRQMGIDILDQEGNLRDMGGVIEEVAQKWGTWTDAQQQAAAVAIAGKRQYNNLIALFENWDMYESSLATSQNAEGTLEEQQNIYKESIRAMVQEVETAKEGFKGELFDAKSVEAVTNALAGFFKVLEKITHVLGGLKNMLPLILGLVMKMFPAFSGTLAKGFHDFFAGAKNLFTHSKGMKNAATSTEEYTNALNTLKKAYGENSKAAKDFIETEEKANKARQNRLKLTEMRDKGLITDEQYQQAKENNEAWLRNIEKHQQAIIERKNADQRDSYKDGRSLSGGNTLSAISTGVEESKKFAENSGTDLANLSKKGLKDSNKTYARYVENVTKKLDKMKIGVAGVNEALKKSNKDYKEAAKELGKLAETKYLTKDQQEELKDLQTQLANISNKSKAEQTVIEKSVETTVNNLQKEYEELADHMLENAEKAARGNDELATSADNVQKSEENVNKELDNFKGVGVAQAAMDMAGSFLTAMGAGNVLKDALLGLKDGTMSAGEAFTAVTSSVLAAVPAFSSSFQMIKTAGTGAGVAIQKAFGWISLAANVITIGVSVIKGLKGLFKKKKGPSEEEIAQKNLKAVKDTLETVQTNLKKAREEYAELKTEMADYRDARRGIDELRAGTEEWKDAVDALNIQVLELIEKYPKLQLIQKEQFGKTIYELDSASIDEAFKAAKQGITFRESLSAFAQLQVFDAQRDLDERIWEGQKDKLDTKTKKGYSSTDDAKAGIKKEYEYLESIFGEENISYSGYAKSGERTYRGKVTVDIDAIENNLSSEKIIELTTAIEGNNDLTEQQKDYALSILEGIDTHNKTLTKNNALLEAQMEKVEQDIAQKENINATVFSRLAQTNTNSSGFLDISQDIGGDAGHGYSDSEERRDFIRNKGDNYLTFIAQDEDGNVKFDDDGKLQTEIRGSGKDYYVGGEIVEADLPEVTEWLAHFAKIAFDTDNVTIEGVDKTLGKNPDKDELDDVEITVNGTKMTIDELRSAAMAGAWRQKIKQENEALIKVQKDLQNQGKLEEAAYFYNAINGKQVFNAGTFTWEEGTLDKYNTIASYGGEVGTNADTARKAFLTEINGYLDSIGKGSDNQSITTDLVKYLTGSEIKSLTNAISNAGLYNGETALIDLITSQTPEKIKAIQELLKDANWESTEWITNFQLGLHDLGVDLEDSRWQDFFNTVNSGMKQWIDDSERVRENLALINKTLRNLELGGTLSDEEYKQALAIDPTLAKYFIQSPEGWVSLISGEKLAQKANQKYSDLGALHTGYAKIRSNAEAAKEYGVKAGEAQDADQLAELLTYFGFQGTFTENGQITDLWLKNRDRLASIATLLGKSAADMANYIYTNLWASDNREKVTQQLGSWAKKADQIMIDYESGYYDSGRATEIYATSGVSYSEAETAGALKLFDANGEVTTDRNKAVNKDTVDNIEKYFANKYRIELGVSDEFGTSVKDLETAANLKYKQDLDHYAIVEKKLDSIDSQLEIGTGQNRWNLYGQKINTVNEETIIAKQNQEDAQEAFDLAWEGAKTSMGFKIAQLYNEKTGIFDLAQANELLIRYRGTEKEGDIKYLIDTWLAKQDSDNEYLEKQNNAIETGLEFFKAIRDSVQKIVEFQNEEKEFWDVTMSGDFLKDPSVQSQYELINQKAEGAMTLFDKTLDSMLSFISSENALITNDFLESYDSAKNQLLQYKELIRETEDLWLSTVDKILNSYDEQIARFKSLNSILNSSTELLKLIGGDSSLLDGYYKAIETNAGRMYSGALEKMQQAQKIYDAAQTDEEKKKAAEALESVTQEFLSASTEWVNIIQTNFTEKISKAINDTLKTYTKYGGYAELSQAWELETAADERYLDEVNKAYAIGEFERKIQKSIDETDNLNIQQRLNNLRAKELKLLEEKGKLTQYDLDRANAEYELELKRIALEEAQQAKNKMQLVRDASGNYTYQYVADQNAIAQAEEELAAARNNLYNLDKDRKKELIDEWFTMMSDYETKMSEAMATGNTALQESVQDYYFGSNGILKAIQDELKLMGLNTNELDNIFNKTSERIMKIEIVGEKGLGKLLEPIVAETSSAITGAFTKINNLFKKDGALGLLLDSEDGLLIKGANTAAAALEDLANGTDGAVDILIGNLSTLSTNIETYTTNLVTALEKLTPYKDSASNMAGLDAAALATNTEAIRDLTASAYTLIDKFDNDDQIGAWFSGKENSNYGWDEEQAMYVYQK